MRQIILILVSAFVLVAGGLVAPTYAEQNSKKKAAASDELRINLNTDSATELARLPGIGEKVAARVVAYRKKNGPFQKVEEVMNVKGIGEKTFSRLEPHLFIEPDSKKKNKN